MAERYGLRIILMVKEQHLRLLFHLIKKLAIIEQEQSLQHLQKYLPLQQAFLVYHLALCRGECLQVPCNYVQSS